MTREEFIKIMCEYLDVPTDDDVRFIGDIYDKMQQDFIDTDNFVMKFKKDKDNGRKDKELLLTDLCGRLPYGVICKFTDTFDGCEVDNVLHPDDITDMFRHRSHCGSRIDVKPYLRPMSSMTEEEREEYIEYAGYEIEESVNGRHYEYCLKDFCGTPENPSVNTNGVDWLNKKMFDFRGLIPAGLAEIAPEGMYELKLLNNHLSSQNESDSVIDNTPKITVGCKIRSKTKPIEILSIISNDCHGDEFECSNGSVLSLKQIEKYYELIK